MSLPNHPEWHSAYSRVLADEICARPGAVVAVALRAAHAEESRLLAARAALEKAA